MIIEFLQTIHPKLNSLIVGRGAGLVQQMPEQPNRNVWLMLTVESSQ